MCIFLTVASMSQSAFALDLKTSAGASIVSIECENPKAQAVLAANLHDKDVSEVRILEDRAVVFYAEKGSDTTQVFTISKKSTCKVSAQF